METLQGKVAVVTGGSRGVGKGIASELSRHGARVFVTGRSEQDLQHAGERTVGIRCDHQVDAQVIAAFQQIAREGGSIDILVSTWPSSSSHTVSQSCRFTREWFVQKKLWNLLRGWT